MTLDAREFIRRFLTHLCAGSEGPFSAPTVFSNRTGLQRIFRVAKS
jgi:hypothetical protein